MDTITLIRLSCARLVISLIVAGMGALTTLAESQLTIPTRLFDPGFLEGDCNYHNLTSASDGNLYFTLGTHNDQIPTHIYRFDPTSEQITLIANLSEVLGESPQEHIPHGKIHTLSTMATSTSAPTRLTTREICRT